jgi:hypothetical protein
VDCVDGTRRRKSEVKREDDGWIDCMIVLCKIDSMESGTIILTTKLLM